MPRTLLVLDACDHLLPEAARLHCTALACPTARRIMSPHRIGTLLSRRERADLTCPLRHARKLTAVLWCLLQTGGRDAERAAIRRVLGRAKANYGSPT